MGTRTIQLGDEPVEEWVTRNGYTATALGRRKVILSASVREGKLEFHIDTRGFPKGTGGTLFGLMIEALRPQVMVVVGRWEHVPLLGEVQDNLATYRRRLEEGATPEAAAAATFTGKMAIRHGFTEVRQVESGLGIDGLGVAFEFSR